MSARRLRLRVRLLIGTSRRSLFLLGFGALLLFLRRRLALRLTVLALLRRWLVKLLLTLFLLEARQLREPTPSPLAHEPGARGLLVRLALVGELPGKDELLLVA